MVTCELSTSISQTRNSLRTVVCKSHFNILDFFQLKNETNQICPFKGHVSKAVFSLLVLFFLILNKCTCDLYENISSAPWLINEKGAVTRSSCVHAVWECTKTWREFHQTEIKMMQRSHRIVLDKKNKPLDWILRCFDLFSFVTLK